MVHVIYSKRADIIESLLVNALIANISNEGLLVEIPSDDLIGYATSVVDSLSYALLRAVKGNQDTETTLATVMLYENMLAPLPSYNTRNLFYPLLRKYNIAPFSNISHITLEGFVQPFQDTFIVRVPLLQKLYIPLRSLTKSARITCTQMLEFFLNFIWSSTRREMIFKAADLIVTEFKADLIRKKVQNLKKLTG